MELISISLANNKDSIESKSSASVSEPVAGVTELPIVDPNKK